MVKITRARPLMGTLVIVSADGDRRAAERGVARALAAVTAVEKRMSFFHPDSDVSRLNREAFKGPVVVHPQTYQVLREAQQMSLLSEGVFDVATAGVLVRDGFLPRAGRAPAPSPRSHFSDIRLGIGRRVWFRRPLWIDLGGIAKGFAVDQALAALRRAKVKKGWVNAGGDVSFFSDRPESLWVRHPHRLDKMVSLGKFSRGALASSAPAYRARFRSGRWVSPYVHRGESNTMNTGVTVAAPRAIWADALTKIVLLSPEKAPALLGKFQARAWVWTPVGNRLTVREIVP